MNDEKLRKTQLVELKILISIDKICKDNNIDYCLSYGTLLGAIRHKGFIPWDDDLDIVMSRKNYQKFIDIAQDQLGEDYYLHTHYSDEKYQCGFARVRYRNSCYMDESSSRYDWNSYGCWADVFPLDNVPNNKLLLYTQYYVGKRILNTIINYRSYTKSDGLSLKGKVLFFLSRAFPLRYMIKLRDLLFSACKDDNSEYIVNFQTPYNLRKELNHRSYFFPSIKKEFEGAYYSCPCRYDDVLINIYGDYMSLPPVEDRTNAHIPIKWEIQ